MTKTRTKTRVVTAVASLVLLAWSVTARAETYRVAWSHYTGWEPWAYAEQAGILKKHADTHGVEIELMLVNDYIESINLYTSGQFIACTMTNMDALTIPAVGGIDSTALIIGDFSNGNDGIVLKQGTSVADLKDRQIMLVELSVSHYLLARALAQANLTERQVTLVNTSDADIGAVFLADPNGAAVTWNPILMQARNAKDATLIFDSSKIPGEIIDLMVIRTDAPEAVKKALTGAWYETLAAMSGRGKAAKEALAFMAEKAGATVKEFEAQLRTTAMFYQASEASAFATGEQLKQTMENVRTFSFEHGLFQAAASKDLVGIAFPDGSSIGDPKNIKLRFDATYMQLAAEGKL